jgi:cytochrome c oxidase subunit 2
VQGRLGPVALTSQASDLTSDWVVFLICGACVALLVWGLILFAVFRWRRRASDGLPPQFNRNNALEIGWVVAPLVLVIVLFVYTYRVEARVEALVPQPDLSVAVTAFRWGWTFAYQNGPVVTGTANAPPQLVLPVGETVQLTITASDVDHAFWVPAFLFKRDAIPGVVTSFDLRPLQIGTYQGRCAEFCGLQHALMDFSVKVVSPSDYAAWRTRGTT